MVLSELQVEEPRSETDGAEESEASQHLSKGCRSTCRVEGDGGLRNPIVHLSPRTGEESERTSRGYYTAKPLAVLNIPC